MQPQPISHVSQVTALTEHCERREGCLCHLHLEWLVIKCQNLHQPLLLPMPEHLGGVTAFLTGEETHSYSAFGLKRRRVAWEELVRAEM